MQDGTSTPAWLNASASHTADPPDALTTPTPRPRAADTTTTRPPYRASRRIVRTGDAVTAEHRIVGAIVAGEMTVAKRGARARRRASEFRDHQTRTRSLRARGYSANRSGRCKPSRYIITTSV